MTTTIKIQIKEKCNHCNGQAYLPSNEVKSYNGEIYNRYLPCVKCHGTGQQTRWIDLNEFITLLDEADPMEPDYEALSQQEPTSQYRDSCDAAGI